MLKMFLLITALSAGSAARHYYLKSHYNWDEYIQVCSSALADLIRAICPGNYNVDPSKYKLYLPYIIDIKYRNIDIPQTYFPIWFQ